METGLINKRKMIIFHVFNIIFFIFQFSIYGIGHKNDVNSAKQGSEIVNIFYLFVTIFFLLIYPIIYLKLEKIKNKILFLCFLLLQLLILNIMIDKVIFFKLWILDWKYYLCTFLFLNMDTLKYLKTKIGLSFIGHFYIIYNLWISFFESNRELGKLTSFNGIIFSIFVCSGIISLLIVFKNYYNKEELEKFNNALYFYYAQLLTFSILVIGYYQI